MSTRCVPYWGSVVIVIACLTTPLLTRGADTVLVPAGATWQYEASGGDLGTEWRNPGYNDTGWASGPAQLGYGDGDERTLLPATPVRWCYYFRHTFSVADPAAYQALSLEALRDDGCVVYLNGQEVARYNMPAGAITYTTPASTASEFSWDAPQDIANRLVSGANVLAVEVHQANLTSTDISLDLRLTGSSQLAISLNSPSPDATGVPQPVALTATPTSPVGGNLNVAFYGRTSPIAGLDFTVVVLPDIQKYTAETIGGTKEMFFSQINWIKANRNALNIAYVAQLGDISDTGDQDIDESEWSNASTGFYQLEPDAIPYGLAVGNHDQLVPTGDTEPTTLYNEYFGLSHFGPRIAGSYDGIRANNQYQVFTASGLNFIVIYLEYDTTPDAAVLDWADGLLRSHPEHRGIVISHYLLETTAAWGVQGQAIYNALKDNPNLVLMLCGHNAGEARRTDVYSGNTVHTLLADYQGYANGGSGYLRILQFSPANNELRVQTYSPWLQLWETDASSQFTLSMPLGALGGFDLLGQVAAVPSGTPATVTWNGLASGGTYEWYASASVGSESAASEVRHFTVALNTPPTVTITSPLDGSSAPAGTLTITANAADSDGTIDRVEFFDGATSIGTGTSSGTDYVASFEPLIGDHFLTAVAYDNGGAFTTSARVWVTVGDIAPPVAPENVIATAISPTQIEVAWTDSSSGELGFRLLVFNGIEFAPVAVTGPGVTAVTLEGLAPDTTYVLKVQAYNGGGASESAAVEVTTPALPPVPYAPSNLTATPVSTTEIALNWNDNSTDETGFVVERSVDQTTWTQLPVFPADTVATVDSALLPGTAYYYRVYAYNSSGSSALSGVAAAAPFIDATAAGESLVTGTLTGDRTATFAADSVYEGISEKTTGAKQNRTSALEHRWTFNVGQGKSTFFFKGYQSPSSDGDNFVLAWSADDVTYADMFVVSATADGGSYQIFELPPGVQGTVYIRARDTDRTIGNTALDTLLIDHLYVRTDASPIIGPSKAPFLMQAVAGDGSVSLAWNGSAGAETYTIRRRTSPGASFDSIGQTAATTFTDNTAANGITYYYTVCAVNSYGESPESNILAATPQPPAPPEPPSGLLATAAKRRISLTWVQSPTPGIVENLVYYSANGTGFTLLATIPPGTSYTDPLASDAKRWYYVTARTSAGESVPSNTVTATAR